MTKSGREIMEIFEAFDLTGTAWSAAALAGCDSTITGRLLAAGGRAAIASRPGAGTTITAITAGSVLVLRGAPGWRPAWAVAVIALAASTAAAAASPAGELLAVNWARWLGVAVLG